MKWQPIAIYDAMKERPKNVVFLFKASKGKRSHDGLSALVDTSRNYGNRECMYFCEIPPIPDDAK